MGRRDRVRRALARVAHRVAKVSWRVSNRLDDFACWVCPYPEGDAGPPDLDPLVETLEVLLSKSSAEMDEAAESAWARGQRVERVRVGTALCLAFRHAGGGSMPTGVQFEFEPDVAAPIALDHDLPRAGWAFDLGERAV